MNLNCFAVNKPECFWCNINLNLCKWIYLSLYLIRYADRLKSVQKVKRIAFSSRVDHWYFFFIFLRRIPSEQWTLDSRPENPDDKVSARYSRAWESKWLFLKQFFHCIKVKNCTSMIHSTVLHMCHEIHSNSLQIYKEKKKS